MAAFDFGETIDARTIENILNNSTLSPLPMQKSLQQAWQMFASHVGEFIGFALVIFVAGLFTSLFDGGTSLLFSIVSPVLYAGYTFAAFRLLHNETVQFSDFFQVFHYFLPLALGALAMNLLVWIGFVVLILPGIYLAVAYVFTNCFIIDYKMQFWQAMEVSRRLISRHWFGFLGFMLVLACVNMLGLLAFGIGLLVSLPVTFCAIAVAYKEIVHVHALEP